MNAETQNNGNNWLLFFFFYKCFRISKAYTHLISHLSLKLSCWAGRADVSGFAPSFWEGGSDGASDLLSIAQLQKAVLRPFTKLSNSPSYGFFPSTVCLYVARKPQQPEVNQVTVKVRSSIQGTWPNSKFSGWEADRSGGMAVVQLLSHVQLFATRWRLQHARLPCPSLSPRVCTNSCPLSRWCYLTISCSAAPFSSCSQSSPASGFFPVSWLFMSGGQSNGASALVSVLPMKIQGCFSLGLISLISFLSKGLSRVFSGTQFENINSLVLSLLYSWPLTSIPDYWETHSFDYTDPRWQSDVSAF